MYNKAQIIGNVGRVPEFRVHPQSGVQQASFSVATSEGYRDKQTGEKKEFTEWVNVIVWGPQAQAVKNYVQKGTQVFVVGKIKTDRWEHEGQKQHKTYLKAGRVLFLSRTIGQDGVNDGNQAAPMPSEDFGGLPIDEDLPY